MPNGQALSKYILFQSDGRAGIVIECCRPRYEWLKAEYGLAVQQARNIETVKHCGLGCIFSGK